MPFWGGGGYYSAPFYLDATTMAWVAAVYANGGTVSDFRKGLVNSLILGLKADGVWTKLDRLWLYAMENQFSALTDIVAHGLGTAVSSPGFAVDDGYTGNGSTSYVQADVVIGTAGINFTTNDASMFAWSNTDSATTGPIVAENVANNANRIYPRYTDTNSYFSVNIDGGGGDAGATNSGSLGFFCATRLAAGTMSLYKNGAFVRSSSLFSSTTVPTGAFMTYGRENSAFDTRQVSCMGFGVGLTNADNTNLYNRLRTYMTAVGVP